ncbi:MAG TPA: hypothetical protein V6C84_02895 [Coleofasciculaceae cyanobacterium]|jgi:hypothetical protein
MLTRSDYEDYLVRLYFGSETDLLLACMNRAYRDFNRTLHQLKKLENGKESKALAVISLRESIHELKFLLINSVSQAVFDDWHRETCKKLIDTYTDSGYDKFTVGQAQKWINMTLKYIFTCGEERISGFSNAYSYCHIPLDNILIEKLEKYDFPKLSCAWSRINDYGEYLMGQVWVRQTFKAVPLDVEFLLWLGKEVNVS